MELKVVGDLRLVGVKIVQSWLGISENQNQHQSEL